MLKLLFSSLLLAIASPALPQQGGDQRFSLEPRKLFASPVHPAGIHAMAMSPQGNLLATAGKDGKICIVNAADGQALLMIDGHQAPVNAVTFSEYSNYLVSADQDGFIKMWNLKNGTITSWTKRQAGWLFSLSLSANGTEKTESLAAGTIGEVAFFWPFAQKPPTSMGYQDPRGVYGPTTPYTFVMADRNTSVDWPNAKIFALSSARIGGEDYLAFGGESIPLGVIKVRDAEIENVAALGENLRAVLRGVALTRDASIVAAAYSDGKILVWQTDNGRQLAELTAGSAPLNTVSFSKDENFIIAGGNDGQITVWSIWDYKKVLGITAPGKVFGAYFSPTRERIFAATDNGTVYSWDISGSLPAPVTAKERNPKAGRAAAKASPEKETEAENGFFGLSWITLAALLSFILLTITGLVLWKLRSDEPQTQPPAVIPKTVTSRQPVDTDSEKIPQLTIRSTVSRGTAQPSLPLGTVRPHQPSKGPLIGGKYEIQREIGRGGMAIVYEAIELALDRKVALKKMREEIGSDPREKQYFLQEARLTAKLKHTNIVDIYTIMEEADLWLVFEFIEGRTLSQVLSQYNRLPVKESAAIMTHILSALQYAHENGVVHRDLKPSNIMIRADGMVKVMDFGIAKIAKETVSMKTGTAGDTSGTFAYMAPEQHIGKSDRQADIFALGVTFYEMLTGQLPFRGPDFLAQKERMIYTPLRTLAPEISDKAAQLVITCMEPDREKRYKTAAEVLAAVKQL